MRLTPTVLIPFAILSLSKNAFSQVEMEIHSGPSTKWMEGEESEDESEEDESITSLDMGLYLGYRFKGIFSIGWVATHKNYDLNKAAESLKGFSDSFYQDPDIFTSGPATEEKGTAEGSLKGIVHGPQITVAYPGRYIQPYIKVSYQVGTLKSAADYKSWTSYGPSSISLQTEITDERSSDFTQVGLGFRIPMSSFYLSMDAAWERMHFVAKDSVLRQKIIVDDNAFEAEESSDTETDDAASGTVFKLGLGFIF